MRTSKKQQLIEAAIEIVEKQGVNAVTYESLAAAAGMSKSGLIYHFPSRKALLNALNQYMAANWEREMITCAGAQASELTELERLRAAFLVMSRSATLADLLLTIDAVTEPELMQPWHEVMRRWCVPPLTILDNPNLYLLQVIADGLWVHDHLNELQLSREQREILVKRALELISH